MSFSIVPFLRVYLEEKGQTSDAVPHHARTASKSARPLTQMRPTSAPPLSSLALALILPLALPVTLALALAPSSGIGGTDAALLVLLVDDSVSVAPEVSGAAVGTDDGAADDGDGEGVGSASSGRRRNATYAFTNAEGLNLGRQIGSQDAAAEELRIEGEWTVFIRMWRSVNWVRTRRRRVRGGWCLPDG